jgi:acetyl esterase/lipase
MKRTILVLTLLAATNLFGEERPTPSIKTIQDVSFLGGNRSEKLDLYLPVEDSGGRRPAVVVVHGGGFHGGDKAARREQNICVNLARAGYVCASVNYRLCKKSDNLATRLKEVWPTNLHDCKTAVRFLRKNADQYMVDAEHIGAIGGSAGGHLVAMMALTDSDDGLDPTQPYEKYSCRIQAMVAMYGVHDVIAQAELMGNTLSESDVVFCRQASPVAWVTADDPPALILHGTKDALVPVKQSEVLHERLQAAKISTKLVVVEDAPHSFHLQPKQQDLRSEVIGFLDRHLKPKQERRTQPLLKAVLDQ